MTEWFEHEEFWEAVSPVLFSEARLQAADAQVEQVLALAGLRGGAVLDLACGVGRHALAFARRGFRVTGVDRTERYLARARERSQAAGLEVEWVREDMRRFVRPSAFDLAVSLFTSLGYFGNEAADLGILRNLRTSLRPGGVLVIDMAGKEVVARQFQPTASYRLDDGRLFVDRRTVRDGWLGVENEWTLVRGDEARTVSFQVNLYSGRELRDLCQAAGFADVSLFGDLEGRPYGLAATRLVARARTAEG